MKKIHFVLLSVFFVVLLTSCNKSESREIAIVHEEGKTGYRETICDITSENFDADSIREIKSVMKNDSSYFVITKDYSMVDGTTLNTMLYQISDIGEIDATFQINETTNASIFVMVGDKIVCISSNETIVLSSQNGDVITVYQSETNPITATAYGDNYVVAYQDHVVLMDLEGNIISRIDSNEFGFFSIYCDCLYEYGDKLYLVACPGFEYAYFEIDFDNQYCNKISTSSEMEIELADCCGGYIFDSIGEYKIDPSTGGKTLLAEWNNTNVRPGGNPVNGYRYYYVFDDNHFVKSYVKEDGTACIQMYEYDPTIDYSESKYITVGGIALNQDYTLQDAIYRFNSSQSEYRVITQEFENDDWDNEYVMQRNSNLIAEFSNGNAPDIFYGDMFDYDYFGRNGLVIDILPYLQESTHFDETDIESSLWNIMSKDGHCYHLFNSFDLYGYWGKASVMSDNVSMTYLELLELDNPNGTVCSTIYSSWIADYIINESFVHYIDSNGSLMLTEEQTNDVVEFAITYGLPSSASYELLAPDGVEYLRDDEYLMINYSFANLVSYSEAVEIAGENLSFIGFPSVNCAYHTVFTSGSVAVSSSSSYPEACVDFISYMFDDRAQEQIVISGRNSVRTSINNEFFDYAVDPSSVINSVFRSVQLPEEGIGTDVIEAYQEAISLVDTQYISDPTVMVLIIEELDDYELQGKPIEEIAESLYSRLRLYVDEVY